MQPYGYQSWSNPSPPHQEAPASPPSAGAKAGLIVAGLLFLASMVVHVVGLFPTYLKGEGSLSSHADQYTFEAVLAVGWLLAALGAFSIALKPPRSSLARLGVAFGLGVGAAEVGFRLADLGEVFSTRLSVAGAGIWIEAAAWVLGLTGVVVGWLALRGAAPLGRPGKAPVTLVLITAVASVLTAAAFLPSWDNEQAFSAVTGRSMSFTAGNAFNNPGWVIFGDVLVAVVVGLLPIIAALWKPGKVGAVMITGVVTVMAGQLASAVVQTGLPVPPGVFGLTPASASALGLQTKETLTGWFAGDVAAGFILLMIALGTLSLADSFGRRRAAMAAGGSVQWSPPQSAGGWTPPPPTGGWNPPASGGGWTVPPQGWNPPPAAWDPSSQGWASPPQAAPPGWPPPPPGSWAPQGPAPTGVAQGYPFSPGPGPVAPAAAGPVPTGVEAGVPDAPAPSVPPAGEVGQAAGHGAWGAPPPPPPPPPPPSADES